MADSEKLKAETAKLIAQGYDPAKAQQMAEASMLSTEYDWAKRGMEGLGKDYGIRTPGRYGTYVANPGAALAGGFMAGQAMGAVPDIIKRGQEGTSSWLDMLGGMGDELVDEPDPTAATVEALRTPDRPGADVIAPGMSPGMTPTPDRPGADVMPPQGGAPMPPPGAPQGPGAMPSPAPMPPMGQPQGMGGTPNGALPRRPGETDEQYMRRLQSFTDYRLAP